MMIFNGTLVIAFAVFLNFIELGSAASRRDRKMRSRLRSSSEASTSAPTTTRPAFTAARGGALALVAPPRTGPSMAIRDHSDIPRNVWIEHPVYGFHICDGSFNVSMFKFDDQYLGHMDDNGDIQPIFNANHKMIRIVYDNRGKEEKRYIIKTREEAETYGVFSKFADFVEAINKGPSQS